MLSKTQLDLNQLGSFSLGGASGIVAAGLAGGSEVFQFRWTSATVLANIRNIRFSAAVDATGFTAGRAVFDLIIARNWTADGTGGAAVTFAANDNKRRTLYNTTAAPSNSGVRIATTAALGGGTKTLDTNALCAIVGGAAAAGTPVIYPDTVLFGPDLTSEWPITLAQNEGIVIRATVPATGTWSFALAMDWTETNLTAM